MRTTYGFKNAGRKKNADPSRKGSALMPGLYKHRTCVDQLGTQQKTYSFKACDRYHTPTALVGYIDKVCTHNLIECKLLCRVIVCNLLSPMQTEAALLANITPNIMLNVTCCVHLHTLLHVMLGVVVQNKRVKRLSQQLPTFLLLRDRQSLAQQCWISVYTALPTLLGPHTCIITHGLQSLMGCVLPTIHHMSQNCWELLHPLVNNCQHGCNNSQHCWPNNVWICCVPLLVALK